MTDPDTPRCGARAVFWPDVEHIEAECISPRGHQPEDVHEAEYLGEWTENELWTWHPEGDDE
jgi:hypothetical protein